MKFKTSKNIILGSDSAFGNANIIIGYTSGKAVAVMF